MGKLFDTTTERKSLSSAWRRIRSNGASSAASETRSAISRFEQDENGNLIRIQKRLRNDTFEFDPQKGVLKKKSSGGKRGIVMASVQNRIVERAILDRLQADVGFVKSVIDNPYSVGGVPNRSVPHGLQVIHEAIREGKKFFVRSDISAFFDNVPRDKVLGILKEHIDDVRFLNLIAQASTVTLANEQALKEDRQLFPTDDHGVAQGSPLSPLFGNILLNDFDRSMNDRGIVCVRFIDDFILLGETSKSVRKAFESGRSILQKLGLKCHDPFVVSANADKSAHGHIDEGFVFLGYHILPGLMQPSIKARKSLLTAIDVCLKDGRAGIQECLRANDSFANRQRYAQTQDVVDRIVKGWGNSFAYANSTRTFEDLDMQIEERLNRFRGWFSDKARALDWKGRRRAGGVCLLVDIKPKKLEDAPFIVSGAQVRFRTSARTLNVSTDGAVISIGKRKGKDQGPGGWGFVVHETKETESGFEDKTTNNRMELRAVIEALKFVPKDRSLKIHTDSRYVCQGANGVTPIKSNSDLWKEYQTLIQQRAATKIVWVKGHSGNEFNHVADALAGDAARSLAHRNAS